MNSYGFLMDLAVILLSTKILGLITRKLHMPQVVGALLAGLILGPGMLGLIKETAYIASTTEIGVVVLMFGAGMKTDIRKLKESGTASSVIALLGVLFPLAGGFLVASIFNGAALIRFDFDSTMFLQNLFTGVILTATSVSITVEVLKEIGKIDSSSGNAILCAAVIDDILGIIALTIITSVKSTDTDISLVLLKLAGFFIFSALMACCFHKGLRFAYKITDRPRKRHTITVFVLCLFMA